MDFVSILREKIKAECKDRYDEYVEFFESLGFKADTFEEHIESAFNREINCGGYALEVDLAIFRGNVDFERTVSTLLEKFPFIRLLGNTPLGADEYIVKYRTTPGGHHFVKIKDGRATEKNAIEPIQDFTGWAEVLKDQPEAVFAVKREHEIFGYDQTTLMIKEGKDFDDTVSEAYQKQENTFFYHSQPYSFKKEVKTGNLYIYSNGLQVARLIAEDGECIALINEGFEDYVSNTKTGYDVGPRIPEQGIDI